MGHLLIQGDCFLIKFVNISMLSYVFSRLSIIQATIAQQQWRVPHLLKEFAQFLFTHLDHPFKTVREKIGRYNCTVYVYTGRETDIHGYVHVHASAFIDLYMIVLL